MVEDIGKTPGYGEIPEAVNVFSQGMRQDVSLDFRKNNTYSYSMNGRVFNNENGDATYMNEDGNTFGFTIVNNTIHQGVEGYKIIGGCELPDKTVVFSTNETNSEIGILTLKSNGTVAVYTCIYNDLYDPNGDLLGWSLEHKMKKLIPCVESPAIHRVYGTEGYREPFCINTQLGLTANSAEFTSGNYTPLGGYAAGNIYPWFYSAHSFAYQADIIFGRMKLTKQTTAGTLKTGAYQIAYRGLTRDGYTTPWCILSRRFLCTYDETIYTNSHDRQMQASNQYSAHGFTFKIENIDTRHWKAQICYVYSIAEDATVEANIFEEIELTPANLTGSDLVFNLTLNGGIPISLSEFNKKIIPIKRCQTMEQKDDTLYIGNIETYGNFNPFLDSAIVGNTSYTLTQDEEGAVTAMANPNIIPLTKSSIQTTTISLNAFTNTDTATSFADVYAVDDDYLNFSGIQVDAILKSYMPNEVYPVAFTAVDIKGNPYYSINIEDKQTIDSAPSVGLGVGTVRSLGLTVSGVDITDIIYDSETGKQKLGGFAFTRVKRIPAVLFHAIMFPTVLNLKSSDENKTYLLPMPSNYLSGNSIDDSDSLGYDIAFQFNGSREYYSRPFTFIMHSPELSFGYPVFKDTLQDTVTSSDTLKLIYAYGSTFESNTNNFNKLIELNGATRMFYTKNYSNAAFYPNHTEDIGDISTLELSGYSAMPIGVNPPSPYIIETYDLLNQDLDFYFESQIHNTVAYGAKEFKSFGVPGAWLVKTKDFINLGLDDHATNDVAYFIAEYRCINNKYYNTDVINNRLYFGTGHYQPLTTQVIADATQPGNSDKVIFDDVEIFGGDVYPTIFDFVRLYPQYSGDCSGSELDYANGLIIPIWSRINVALRKGRSFANSGLQPQSTACGGAAIMPYGTQVQQPEEFNINSVTFLEENVQFLPGKPNGEDVDKTIFPYRWCYSLKKFSGEKYDNYRSILAANYGDVQGQYGDVVGCAKVFNQIYSIQQKGFGRLRAYDRVAMTTNNGEALNTGLGKVYDGIDYISTKHGTEFPYSILVSPKSFAFVDSTNDCIIRFAGNGADEITNIYQMKNWAQENIGAFEGSDFINLSTGSCEHIHGTYDVGREEYIWSLLKMDDDVIEIQQTIVFSNSQQFTTFTGFQPNDTWCYINCNGYVLSAQRDTDAEVFIQYKGDKGEWYGVMEDTELWYAVNIDWKGEKKFDNFKMDINRDGADLLTEVVLNTLTQVQTLDLTTLPKRQYSNGFYRFPIREPGRPDRMKGHYLLAKLKFKNESNKEIRFVGNETKWRESKINTR